MGTSLLLPPCARVVKDHPHAYGDKIEDVRWSEVDEGSSPRVWGQECVKYNFNPLERIIPTRMGTRLTMKMMKFLN